MTVTPADRVNIVDLFAGCGGFTEGFHQYVPAGADSTPFRTVGAVEIDIPAATTYAANFADEAGGAEHIFPGDIKDWNPGDIGTDVDVILGGPPCQGFSGLGKQDPKDPRNQLWREYIRVVKKLSPKIFIIENVDRFFKSPEYAALKEANETGDLRDYHLVAGHLVAADYGVPQARKRTIVIATQRDVLEEHPEKEPLFHPDASHAKVGGPLMIGMENREPWVPVSEIFGMKGAPLTLETPLTTELPTRSMNLLGTELPGAFRTTELHIGRSPTRESILRYRDIPMGGNRHDIKPEHSTASWMKHRTGAADVMGRLHLDRPSVTIRTEFYKPEKGRYLHPWAHRPITHYEAALIQGFPPEFKWAGSKVQIARQIGNAVPVGLSRAIAASVHEYLSITGVVR